MTGLFQGGRNPWLKSKWDNQVNLGKYLTTFNVKSKGLCRHLCVCLGLVENAKRGGFAGPAKDWCNDTGLVENSLCR